MPSRRALASVLLAGLAAALGACKDHAKPAASGSGAASSAASGSQAAAPIDAAPAGPAIDVPYALPSAKASKPLPASPELFVFVAANTSLRAGETGSLAASTEVPDLGGLEPHLPAKIEPPPPEDNLLGEPDAGFGFGRTGFGPGGAPGGTTIGSGRYGTIGGGMGVDGYGRGRTLFSLAWRGEPSSARVVVVADRAVPLWPLVNVLTAIGEPVALAVSTDHGLAALAMLVGPPATTWITVDNAEALNLTDDGTLDTLVTGLDALAGGTKHVPITVRPLRTGLRGRHDPVPLVRIGQPETVGDLDKAIIRRYLKRNVQKLQYCYEKLLLVMPGLQGRVETEFVISPEGLVVSSKATGMNPVVATCVAEVIKNIEFPKPKGGGIVKVSYPLVFLPSGG